jgi:hypothetical protein
MSQAPFEKFEKFRELNFFFLLLFFFLHSGVLIGSRDFHIANKKTFTLTCSGMKSEERGVKWEYLALSIEL